MYSSVKWKCSNKNDWEWVKQKEAAPGNCPLWDRPGGGDTAVLYQPVGSQQSQGPRRRPGAVGEGLTLLKFSWALVKTLSWGARLAVWLGASPRLSLVFRAQLPQAHRWGLWVSVISLGANQLCRRRTQLVPFLTKTSNVNLARRQWQIHPWWGAVHEITGLTSKGAKVVKVKKSWEMVPD